MKIFVFIFCKKTCIMYIAGILRHRKRGDNVITYSIR